MPPQRRAQGAVSILWGLLVASVVIPTLLLAVATLQSRERAVRDAGQASERIAATLLAQVQSIFQTYELVLDRVSDTVMQARGDELRLSRMTYDRLRSIVGSYEQIGSIWVFDAQGRSLINSLRFPTPSLELGETDFLTAIKDGVRGTIISPAVEGRISGKRLINISRPVFESDGRLRAVIVISAYPDYFQTRFARVAPDLDYSASLVHEDGSFLARNSPVVPFSGEARASAAFMLAKETAPSGHFQGVSTADGVQRDVYYHKLGAYPVYMMFGLGTGAVIANWHEQALFFGLFALAAMLGLGSMTYVALARSRGAHSSMQSLIAETNRRKQMEAKLVTAQRMEALGQLTGGIAHDFNNLLTIVMGNLDLLRRAPDDRRARLIDNGLHAVEQGRRLTQQLLAFGRRQPLRPEPVDVNELVVGMGDMLVQSLRGDIEVDFDLADHLWLVEADPVQLQTTLINLAANARDAMPRGGQFKIRTMNSAFGEGQGVVIIVSDSGTGMEPSVLERAFEPFFTTKDIGRGSGLGLSQVVGFIDQSGGTVEIASEVGRGTSVTLVLPRAHVEPVRAIAPPAALPREQRACSLLLVEDNAQLRELAHAILVEAGHQVIEAANADQALQLLRKTPGIDVVVSDLVMPGKLDGLDLARILRDERPDVRVLLSTGYSEEAAKVHAEGFTLIAKPYQPEMLTGAIQDELARSARRYHGNVISLPL